MKGSDIMEKETKEKVKLSDRLQDLLDGFKKQGLLFYFGAIFLAIVCYSGVDPFHSLDDLEFICFTIVGLVLMILGVQLRIARYRYGIGKGKLG